MHTEIFTIADSADIYDGKLCLLGSFDCLNAPKFPAQHSTCVVVSKIRMEHDDSGDHVLEVHIIDPDGKDVIPPAKVAIHAEIEFGSTSDHTHLWRIQGFPLPKPGTFYIDAMIDGSVLSRTPLYVRKK